MLSTRHGNVFCMPAGSPCSPLLASAKCVWHQWPMTAPCCMRRRVLVDGTRHVDCARKGLTSPLHRGCRAGGVAKRCAWPVCDGVRVLPGVACVPSCVLGGWMGHKPAGYLSVDDVLQDWKVLKGPRPGWVRRTVMHVCKIMSFIYTEGNNKHTSSKGEAQPPLPPGRSATRAAIRHSRARALLKRGLPEWSVR